VTVTSPIVSLQGVSRVYGSGPTEVRALDGVDLDIAAGEFIVLLGPSGSGKTTLLNVIGGIDPATSGSVTVDQQNLAGLNQRQLTEFRRNHVAFIFQFYNLVPTLTAIENVELIAALTGGDRQAARDALDSVGLGDHLDRFPSALSGGQQQRVAIARALAKNTALFLCDEPTGALDQATGTQVLDLLQRLNHEENRTLILVTHDESIAERASRIIRMVDGQIVEDESQ
jgi:putative ABC transport system ATP-binding protein